MGRRSPASCQGRICSSIGPFRTAANRSASRAKRTVMATGLLLPPGGFPSPATSPHDLVPTLTRQAHGVVPTLTPQSHGLVPNLATSPHVPPHASPEFAKMLGLVPNLANGPHGLVLTLSPKVFMPNLATSPHGVVPNLATSPHGPVPTLTPQAHGLMPNLATSPHGIVPHHVVHFLLLDGSSMPNAHLYGGGHGLHMPRRSSRRCRQTSPGHTPKTSSCANVSLKWSRNGLAPGSPQCRPRRCFACSSASIVGRRRRACLMSTAHTSLASLKWSRAPRSVGRRCMWPPTSKRLSGSSSVSPPMPRRSLADYLCNKTQ